MDSTINSEPTKVADILRTIMEIVEVLPTNKVSS